MTANLELNDLIFLGACAIYTGMNNSHALKCEKMRQAVTEAKQIWAKVLEDDK